MNRARLRTALAGLVAGGLAVHAAETNPPPPFAKGPLVALHLSARQLVLQSAPDDAQSFHWTDATYMFRGKDKITASQLKTGDVVAVRFDTGPDGQRVIRRLKTYPAP